MTIATWDKAGQVGQPLRVTVRRTAGRPTRVRVWLSDGAESVLVADEGIEFQMVDFFLTPQRAGTWRVNASAEDVCGNRNSTGLARFVAVQ